jgi:hypothetical protein
MKGSPNTQDFYKRIVANENEHVADLRQASDNHLVPYYGSILAIAGTGTALNLCTVDLYAQLGKLPEDAITRFLTQILADVRGRDVRGKHVNQSTTNLDPDCTKAEILASPTPAPANNPGQTAKP